MDTLSKPARAAAALAMAIYLLISIGSFARAEGNSIAKDFLLLEKVTFCSNASKSKIFRKYSFSEAIEFPENFGSTNKYGRVVHNYDLLRGKNSSYALIAYYSPVSRSNCATAVVFRSTIRPTIVESVADHSGQVALGAKVISTIKDFEKFCIRLGSRADSKISGGEYEIAESGELYIKPEGFSCASAVATNVSSVLVKSSGSAIRVTVVYGEVIVDLDVN